MGARSSLRGQAPILHLPSSGNCAGQRSDPHETVNHRCRMTRVASEGNVGLENDAQVPGCSQRGPFLGQRRWEEAGPGDGRAGDTALSMSSVAGGGVGWPSGRDAVGSSAPAARHGRGVY